MLVNRIISMTVKVAIIALGIWLGASLVIGALEEAKILTK